MRLIDADNIIDTLNKVRQYTDTLKVSNVEDFIDRQPTAYDINERVKQLRERQYSQYEHWKRFGDNESFVAMNIYGCAIGIVKEGLKNNNNALSNNKYTKK